MRLLFFPGNITSTVRIKTTNLSISILLAVCRSGRTSAVFTSAYSEKASCEKQLVHLNAIQFETVLNFQKLILEAKSELSGTTSLKTLLSFLFGIFYTQDESPDMPEWLRDFVQKLNNINFGNDFKLSYIYSYSNYSQTTLCREFKKYTGKTLVSYVNDLKLNYCCNLLQNTSLPLWKIANSVGFYSQAHFTRLFKEKYGITPLQYRKN